MANKFRGGSSKSDRKIHSEIGRKRLWWNWKLEIWVVTIISRGSQGSVHYANCTFFPQRFIYCRKIYRMNISRVAQVNPKRWVLCYPRILKLRTTKNRRFLYWFFLLPPLFKTSINLMIFLSSTPGDDLQSPRLSGHDQRRSNRLSSLAKETPECGIRGDHVLQFKEHYTIFSWETKLHVRRWNGCHFLHLQRLHRRLQDKGHIEHLWMRTFLLA